MFLRGKVLLVLGFVVLFANAGNAFPDQGFYALPRIKNTLNKFKFNNPIEFMADAEVATANLNLLDWKFNPEKWEDPAEKYNRKSQFGTWIRDPLKKTCLNTRGRVLLDDSETEVTYAQSGCSITNGKWHDPYSGEDYSDASEIQIDHMVPLKDAYNSGLAQLDRVHRCVYANFIGNKFHLIPVFGDLNNQKGDRSPAVWIPPNKSYVCEYVANWLKIKTIWNLVLSNEEANGIKHVIQENNCLPENFQLSQADLAGQLRAIEVEATVCGK